MTVPLERIPAGSWREHEGHLARYRYAADHVRPGERVNDIACGVGYGSTFLAHADYVGYDRAGVPDAEQFPVRFEAADLDDPLWVPASADVTTCFETLEHVKDPARLAAVIAAATRRAVVVSVPLYPASENPFHLTDFTTGMVPPMFPGFRVADEWAQPEERGHVWLLEREA